MFASNYSWKILRKLFIFLNRLKVFVYPFIYLFLRDAWAADWEPVVALPLHVADLRPLPFFFWILLLFIKFNCLLMAFQMYALEGCDTVYSRFFGCEVCFFMKRPVLFVRDISLIWVYIATKEVIWLWGIPLFARDAFDVFLFEVQ